MVIDFKKIRGVMWVKMRYTNSIIAIIATIYNILIYNKLVFC